MAANSAGKQVQVQHQQQRQRASRHAAAVVELRGAIGTSSEDNDNGLAETKNGAVVRKLFGYEHIPQRHAGRFNTFCLEYLNPLLNFHRPCLFATDVADPKKPGRIKRVYRAKGAMTPLDKLAQPAWGGNVPARGHHPSGLARTGHGTDRYPGG